MPYSDMTAHDHEQIVKRLMMTTSSNDNEALTALRKAQAVLDQYRLNWQEYLAMAKQPSQADIDAAAEYYGAPKSKRSTHDPDGTRSDGAERSQSKPTFDQEDDFDWGAYLKRLIAKVKVESGRNFLTSLLEAWETYGRLSDKQKAAAKKWDR